MKAMGGLLPLISFLLIQVVVVAGGNDRTGISLEGAIANPAEVKAYWEATLPNTPMPQAVLDVLGQLQGQANDGDNQKMEKFYLYNKGKANHEDDQKMGRFYLYNKGQANEGDDQEMKKFYLYNKDKTNNRDDQKMRRFYLYNKDQANNEDDQKMKKFYLYNKAQTNEADDQKMRRFYLYNKGQANNRDDQNMGRFYLYNNGQANDENDKKMKNFYLYNKAHANNEDDQKMGRFYLYNKAQTNDGDDQKMGRFYLYNKAQTNNKDDQKMEKFYLYNKDQVKDVVEQKMKKFYLYNKGQDNEMDDQKMEKFYLYNRGQTNDIDDRKLGEEHKHIHSHGHGHVHFPKGARDMFFFEDIVAPGSVLTTRILSTRSSSIFLHRNSSKHIPFSMKNFANIVNMFAPVSVTMANDIASTLEVCEHPQTVHGEKAGCAASIESFLDLVVSSLGTDDVRALSPGVPMEGVPSLRYIVASATPVPNSQSILACHDMPYPYKVFFCHMAMQARAYQVSLVSDDESGGVPSIDALAVCHLNTSHWDADHPFFKLMDVKPGETTACHFLGRGSIVWVPAVQEATQ